MNETTTSLIFPDFRIIRMEQTGSTNSDMVQWSEKERLPEGSLIVADNQTNGRGQGGNTWESEPGCNLTFTMVLYPTFIKGAAQFLLSKMISLAVCDFVSKYAAPVSVKWPNDVYVGEKKIAGILIENFIEGAYLTKTIAGIGVNINQKQFTGNAPNPVSLEQLTGKTYSVNDCLCDLMECIAKRYSMLRQQAGLLNDDYLRNLYRLGKLHSYSADGQVFEARITGVNKYGMLEMITSENQKKTFGFGDVAFK